MVKNILSLACASFILLFAPVVHAAAYPEKNVQFVVPAGPGGSGDVATRLLLKTFNKNLAKEGVVVNVAGAGGSIGTRKVYDAAPDGYTLLSFNTILPVLRIMNVIDFTYADLAPVALFATSDTGIFVREDSSYKNVQDLIADAKKRPGKVRFGVGFGTLAHLGALALEQKTGIKLNIVDVGSGDQKSAALMGGHIDACFEPTPPMMPYLEGKTFRILGVFSEKRNARLPATPTLREQGVDLVLMQNNGIFAPKGTPQNALDALRAAIRKTCESPEFQQELTKQTLDVVYMDGQQYIDLLTREYEMLKSVATSIQP